VEAATDVVSDQGRQPGEQHPVRPRGLLGVASARLRHIAGWLILGATVIYGGAFVVLGIFVMWQAATGKPGEGWLIAIIQAHFAATVGLPAGALIAMAVVQFLEFSSGPIEFEGLGFKFRGASGPVVLWMMCFLAVAAAIRLVW